MFALVYLATQLTGQLVLALAALALMAHLEISDSVRDAQALAQAFSGPRLSEVFDPEKLEIPPYTFSQIAPFALLGLHAFYATGHQSTIPSLQWKSAFLFSSIVTPLSGVSVVLNTAGPQAVLALAVPLLACWQVVTGARVISGSWIIGESVRAAIGLMLYYGVLLLSTAASAAILRRHLMVWKVFAPRFMAAAIELVAVDAVLIVGVALGVGRLSECVDRLLQRTAKKGS